MVAPRCPVCSDYYVIPGTAGERCPCERLSFVMGVAYVGGFAATELGVRVRSGEDADRIMATTGLTRGQIVSAVAYDTHRIRIENRGRRAP